MKQSICHKVFVSSIIAAVMLAVGIGLYLSGTPNDARAKKFDQQRITDLTQISQAIDSYYNTANRELPNSLDQLNQYAGSLADPLTNTRYEYRVTSSTTYELCAVFQTEERKSTRELEHSTGRACFTRTVNLWPKPRPIWTD